MGLFPSGKAFTRRRAEMSGCFQMCRDDCTKYFSRIF